MEKATKQPGGGLLDRYFPNADDETRERARAAFLEYAVALARLGERIERDIAADRDWREKRRRPIMETPPPGSL